MSDELKYPVADGPVLAIPLKEPYIEMATPKADTILSGKANLIFPNQCAWCGSSQVTGVRWVRTQEANSGYLTKGKRMLKEGIAYAVGGGIAGVMGYSVLRPQDAEKIPAVAIDVALPHCGEHEQTPPDDIICLKNSRFVLRSPEYASLVASMNNPVVTLPSLTGIVWPDQCIICGSQKPESKLLIEEEPRLKTDDTEKVSVEAPVCEDDLRKSKSAGFAKNIIFGTGFLVALVIGALTLSMKSDFWGHVFLFLCVGGIGLVIWSAIFLSIAQKTLKVKDINAKPITLAKKDNTYNFTFSNLRMAQAFRQANAPKPGPAAD